MKRERKNYEQSLKMSLTKKARELGGVSFSEWLNTEAAERERRLHEGKIESEMSYLGALSSHGKNAESMLDSGLSGSGYAQYLDTRAKKTHEARLAKLEHEYDSAIADDIGDYEKHVGTLKKQREDLYNKTVTELTALNVVDYAEAYRAAKNYGVDEDSARRLANQVTKKNRYRLRKKVLNQIINDSMSYSAAISYAEALGLSRDDARELGRYAQKINQARRSTGLTPYVLIETIKREEEIKRKQEEIRIESH